MTRLLLCLLFLSGTLMLPSQAEEKLPRPAFPLKVKLHAEGDPVLTWDEPKDERVLNRRVMLRSTTDLRTTKNALVFPIAGLLANSSYSQFRDWEAPQDVQLYYQLRLDFADGKKVYSEVATLTVPAPKLPKLGHPVIAVDKRTYTLSLIDEKGTTLRRFPIALGQNPKGRKLHYDRACTPEGIYKIYALQPNATFYRAYDLDYPNDVDRARHSLATQANQETPDIGGEIQIHGDGIEENWTAGCIALRDRDMDLLFSLPAINRGTTVIISGTELDHTDLLSDIMLTPQQRKAFHEQMIQLGVSSGRTHKHWVYGLCRLQADNGLRVTGIFDRATRKLLVLKKQKAKAAR